MYTSDTLTQTHGGKWPQRSSEPSASDPPQEGERARRAMDHAVALAVELQMSCDPELRRRAVRIVFAALGPLWTDADWTDHQQ